MPSGARLYLQIRKMASCTCSGTQLYTPWQMMKSNSPSASLSTSPRSAWRSSRLSRFIAATRCWPWLICTPDRSSPKTFDPGWRAANGIRLPPEEQPSSSTLDVATSGVFKPNRCATATRCSGAVCENGCEVYGTWSYWLLTCSTALLIPHFPLCHRAAWSPGPRMQKSPLCKRASVIAWPMPMASAAFMVQRTL